MAQEVPPYQRLSPDSQPWGRWVTDKIQKNEVAQDSALTNLQAQNKSLAAQLNRLQLQIQYLQSLSDFAYNEWSGALTGFTGWSPFAPCEVYISSPTGRIEIGYGGALNGADGYFCYQIAQLSTSSTIVSRDSILNNPAQRVAVTGGASFAPSGWKTTLVEVPENEMLAVQCWVNSGSSFITVFGASLYARVSPGRFSGLNTI